MNVVEYKTLPTEQALAEFLRSKGIPVEEWGTGSAKTVGHLLHEIDVGETVLVERGEELFRKTGFVALTITHRGQQLYEKDQVFDDTKRRQRNLPWSAGEKLLRGEDSQIGLYRLLQEELSKLIDGSGKSVSIASEMGEIKSTGEKRETKESPSYPGLKTDFIRYGFEGELGDRAFRSEGYTLEEPDKVTHFGWRSR